jgi:hypothetical protein
MFQRLAALLLFLIAPAAAHADWYEASSKHFVVYSEQDPDKLRRFATELERFDKALRVMRDFPDPAIGKANRVTVYVVGGVGRVASLAGNSNVAGFYKPRAGGSLAIVPRRSGTGDVLELDAQSILLHEYTHHFMWSMAPHGAFPAWLIEGFAEFHATAQFGKDGSVAIGYPPMYRARGLIRGNALPIQRLMIADTLKLSPEQRDGLYGRGWLLTHYLIFGEPRRGQLGPYIAAINSGKTPMEAAGVFGDLRTLDRELESYKLKKLGVIKLKPEALRIGAVEVRRLSPGEAATMDVRIRSKNGVNQKTAPDVYQDARRAAAPYPGDPAAQVVLAEAAFDARDLDGAEAAADRAIAADAKAIDAYVYKAMAGMVRAQRAGDKSPGTWTAIRKTIATANRLDPEDPEPLILYYRSFADIGVPPPQLARDGLLKAFELAPHDATLRFNTAIMLLKSDKKDLARTLLAPMAYQPHGRGRAQRAAKAIEQLDAGDVPGALAALEGRPQVEDDGD